MSRYRIIKSCRLGEAGAVAKADPARVKYLLTSGLIRPEKAPTPTRKRSKAATTSSEAT